MPALITWSTTDMPDATWPDPSLSSGIRLSPWAPSHDEELAAVGVQVHAPELELAMVTEPMGYSRLAVAGPWSYSVYGATGSRSSRVAALVHESGDDTVKDGAVVEVLLGFKEREYLTVTGAVFSIQGDGEGLPRR